MGVEIGGGHFGSDLCFFCGRGERVEMRMGRYLTTLIGILGLVGGTPVVAQGNADPKAEVFGLRFGDGVLSAKSKGLRLTSVDHRLASPLPYSVTVGPFECYPNVYRLPQQPSTTAWAQLCFAPGVGLQKILWASDGRVADPAKRDRHEPIKQDYRSMKNLLQQKYGVYAAQSEPVRFDVCLETPVGLAQYNATFDDCHSWHTTWRGEYGSVHLEMVVFHRTGGGFQPNSQAGYIRLSYEGPSWNTAWQQYRAGDADAF